MCICFINEAYTLNILLIPVNLNDRKKTFLKAKIEETSMISSNCNRINKNVIKLIKIIIT